MLNSLLVKSMIKKEIETEGIPDTEARKEIGDHTGNTNNPHKVTKVQVGLEKVDNTSDVDKPVSTEQQKAIDSAKNNANEYTDQKIAELINGAPTTLDTLKEIADAMEENQDVVQALDKSIGTKANTSDLTDHTSDTNNPHSVTKEQLGLGDVVESEVATDFSEAETPKFQQTIDDVLDGVNKLKEDLDKLASYRYAHFESNKYINKNGELVDLGGWSATPDFISIDDVVNIRLKSQYGAYAISFYGEANENSFISGQIENASVSVFAPVENAKYVRFCYKNDDNAYYAILKNSKYSVINKVKLNGGKYIAVNGDINSHKHWCYSDFYCVNDIEEFSVENNTSGASVISYYDEYHLFIGRVDNNIGNITQFENMPLQTKYVRFSFSISSDSYINLKTNIDNCVYNVISKSVLCGKKIVAIGDSMVYGHTLGIDKVWLSEISKIYNMNGLNLGINGATLSRFGGNNPENAVWQRICNPNSSKYISDSVLSDADYVVIFAGTNDYILNKLVGTVETDIRNEWSVIGATNLICQNLQERCPNAKICFITPYNITLANHENNTFDYVNAIIKGCELNSVPVFNNFTYGGINFYVQNMASDLTMGDGCHLNENGHKYVSNKYSSFFEQL